MGHSTLDDIDKRLEASDNENEPVILDDHVNSESLQLKKRELNLKDIFLFLNVLRWVRGTVMILLLVKTRDPHLPHTSSVAFDFS